MWLPLPHLLNMLPVQVDAFYRTGASGVAISIVCVRARALDAAARIVLALDRLAHRARSPAAIVIASTPTCSTCSPRR